MVDNVGEPENCLQDAFDKFKDEQHMDVANLRTVSGRPIATMALSLNEFVTALLRRDPSIITEPSYAPKVKRQ